MLIKRPDDIKSSDITPEDVYVNRREFIARAGGVGAAILGAGAIAACTRDEAGAAAWDSAGGDVALRAQDDTPNTYEEITNYNNYYEFGTGKEDPAENSGRFKPLPWTVKVDGLVKKPATYQLDDLVKMGTVGDHIYRMRCVEAWSMVIPWRGVRLGDVLKKLEPLPSAKYVAFETVLRPAEMPGQRGDSLDWPYVEGLRLDEAMNSLTLLANGIYGKPLPNQNGAPLRLVTPWKYGFKGIKSIVRISLVDKEPPTSWKIANAREYGFYANVNPEVDHPRWTQSSERRIGKFGRIKTQMFNGYTEQVQSMYAGMDLRRNY